MAEIQPFQFSIRFLEDPSLMQVWVVTKSTSKNIGEEQCWVGLETFQIAREVVRIRLDR